MSALPRAAEPGDHVRRIRVVDRIEDALALLARKGAWIEPQRDKANDHVRHCLRLPSDQEPLVHLAFGLLERLIEENAVAAAGAADRWSISPSGRATLRRLLSRRGEPQAGETRTTPPPSQPAAMVNPAESPLGWLRRRTDKAGKPLLGDAEFAAGERLRADLFFAALTPRVTTNWSAVPGSSARGSPGGAGDQSDRTLAARERVNRALAAVGPELSGILVDVCGHLKGLEEIEDARGWAKRSAKIVLELALTALARHYGYIGRPGPEPKAGTRVRHWGAEDYRPDAAAWIGADGSDR